MASSASLHAYPSAASSNLHSSKFHALGTKGKQSITPSFITISKRRYTSFSTVRSVLNHKINDNGSAEPTRILLERLFAQTQRLEKQINRDSRLPQVAELGLNLGKLESDLQAALLAFKRKEQDLEEAERKVLSEYAELNKANEELKLREEEISAACSKQEKLEEELREANLKLLSQTREIEELKLRVKERDQEIYRFESALRFKQEEMEKMKNDLAKKSKEVYNNEIELNAKAQIITETNEIIKRQEIELQELRKAVLVKEEETENSSRLLKIEEEKRKLAEADLEKRTMDWLLTQNEVKKLADAASKHAGEANETMGEFKRVKKLLGEVRSELVSSQTALSSSRQKMQEQDILLEKQLLELEEQKRSVESYMNSLKNAQIEVESERIKLRISEAQKNKLERELAIEKDLVLKLQEKLNKERLSLERAIEEKSFLQGEMERKNTEFEKTQNLLLLKESELVEARFEIQHLKSEQVSFKLMLEEKDSELLKGRKMLEKANLEMADLKLLMNSKEEELVQATTMLEDKDQHFNTIINELNTEKVKSFEAKTVVEQIVELTNKLVVDFEESQPSDHFTWEKKQLLNELEFMKESLKTREMEVLAAHRAIAIKDEELKMVLEQLDSRERELKEKNEEILRDGDDLKRLYALAQERIGDRSVGDLAIEKLQLEAAQLEVEAATSALQKLTEMSRVLLNKASSSIESEFDSSIFTNNGVETAFGGFDGWCLGEVSGEVCRLSALTEKLVKEAGIISEPSFLTDSV